MRGILEGVREGLPWILLFGVLSALLKGRILPGWEIRVPLMALGVALLWFLLGVVLRRWRWIEPSTLARTEADNA
jgi:hypothetical protein